MMESVFPDPSVRPDRFRLRQGAPGVVQALEALQQQKKAQPQRPAKQNAQKGQQAPQRPERETEPRTQRAAAQPPKAERPQPAQRPARSRGKKAEEDPGLLLISRRPPAQKFASFEEYIQSHGGVTAPIEGDGEE